MIIITVMRIIMFQIDLSLPLRLLKLVIGLKVIIFRLCALGCLILVMLVYRGILVFSVSVILEMRLVCPIFDPLLNRFLIIPADFSVCTFP